MARRRVRRYQSLLTPSFAQTTTAKMGHEDAVYLAKLAEQAERYEGTYKAPGPRAAGDVGC